MGLAELQIKSDVNSDTWKAWNHTRAFVWT